MKVEVVAIGTELLLGQINDTNSSWIGEQLALAGLDTHYQTKVGDNRARVVEVLRLALNRSDAVICCGGLGPTQDDLTRDAIAEVMGADLVRDDVVVARITAMYWATIGTSFCLESGCTAIRPWFIPWAARIARRRGAGARRAGLRAGLVSAAQPRLHAGWRLYPEDDLALARQRHP